MEHPVTVDIKALKHAAEELIRRKRKCREITKAEDPLQCMCTRCKRFVATVRVVGRRHDMLERTEEYLCPNCDLSVKHEEA